MKYTWADIQESIKYAERMISYCAVMEYSASLETWARRLNWLYQLETEALHYERLKVDCILRNSDDYRMDRQGL